MQGADHDEDVEVKVNNMNILEDLGSVVHIVSDKTGTLTKNQMIFRAMSVGCGGQDNVGTFKFYAESKDEARRRDNIVEDLSAYQRVGVAAQFNSNANADGSKGRALLLNMSLNHAVHSVTARDNQEAYFLKRNPALKEILPDKLFYFSTSPDELSLVSIAAELGFVFMEDELPEGIEVLRVLDFDSTRKRMSVVARVPSTNGAELRVFIKGADTAIMPLCFPNSVLLKQHSTQGCGDSFQEAGRIEAEREACEKDLTFYARKGWRTLSFAQRSLNESDYERWDKKYACLQSAMERCSIEDKKARSELKEQLSDMVAELEEGRMKVMSGTSSTVTERLSPVAEEDDDEDRKTCNGREIPDGSPTSTMWLHNNLSSTRPGFNVAGTIATGAATLGGTMSYGGGRSEGTAISMADEQFQDAYQYGNTGATSFDLSHANRIVRGQPRPPKLAEYLGHTAIEDVLQDNLRDSIESYRLAGITLWVLTGDKVDTAVAISESCGLLDEDSLDKLYITEKEFPLEEVARTTKCVRNLLWSKYLSAEGSNGRSPYFGHFEGDYARNNDRDTHRGGPCKRKDQALVIDGSSLILIQKCIATATLEQTLSASGYDIDDEIDDAVSAAAFKEVVMKKEIEDLFFKILNQVKVVVACRTTPQQKAHMVAFAKKLDIKCQIIDEKTSGMRYFHAKMNHAHYQKALPTPLSFGLGDSRRRDRTHEDASPNELALTMSKDM